MAGAKQNPNRCKLDPRTSHAIAACGGAYFWPAPAGRLRVWPGSEATEGRLAVAGLLAVFHALVQPLANRLVHLCGIPLRDLVNDGKMG